MQFSSQTEYSIRVLMFLACQQLQGNKSASISTLSKTLEINKNYLPKILKPLKDSKILNSEAGIQGGFSLAIDPEKLSLLDIFEITEGTTRLNLCIDESEECNLNRESICPVRKTYENFQKMFDEYFSKITLADLAQQELDIQQNKNM